jgi:hypothetical protein
MDKEKKEEEEQEQEDVEIKDAPKSKTLEVFEEEEDEKAEKGMVKTEERIGKGKKGDDKDSGSSPKKRKTISRKK